MITTLGGRRYVMAMGCGIACTALVWFGKISDGIFATIVLGTVGAYITGNLAQRAMDKSKPEADA